MTTKESSHPGQEARAGAASMADAERKTILQEWSGPAFDPDLARDELLHELFEAQADQRPGNTAVICGDQRITYAELERRANQLAHHLRSQGVGRGGTVAMLLPRSADVYVAILGILKAGAAYVPLDPEYPADRVAYILADCKVHTLITTSDLAARHEPFPGRTLLLDQHGPAVAREPLQRLCRRDTDVGNTDLCYIIYTSGSTGRPKGVQIEHRSACNLVRAEGRIYGVQPEDSVYQGFSIAFDASVEEVWMALFSGAALVVGTAEMTRGGPDLCRSLTHYGVTVLSTVPTLLSMMEDDAPAVRLLILGGETCPADLVRRWSRPGRRLMNTYGPTEATVIATHGEARPGELVTIGRPVPNYRIYILDEHLQPVPPGEGGEICIGGVGLSRGYVGRPDLTAEKFVANPFGHADAPRLYRTGDLARWTSDGQIDFMGRIDTQVKIRGFRVELAEIESVLMQCPQVRTAVAAVREESGIQQLIGYVIPRGGRTINEDAIKAHLRTLLPAYMVPALLEAVDDLPTLPSGKVDRKRLPAPRPRQEKAASAAEPPQGELEQKLAQAWGALFKQPVSRRDDFFLDLGGHSLLAAAVVSQLRKEERFSDLSVTDIYSFPTVQALAAELQKRNCGRAEAQSQAHSGPPTEPAERATPIADAGLQWRYYLCAAGQLVGLFFVLGLYSMQWLAPYMVYSIMVEDGLGIVESIVGALAVLLAFYPLSLVLSIGVKWLVIGRFKAGRYRLWGWYYFRWWLVNQVLSTIPIDYLSGTPLLGLYYRLMGAKVGRRVYLHTDNMRSFDLVSVGDDTSVGHEASLLGYTVEDGFLIQGPIRVGQRCFVGVRSILRHNTAMEDDSRLADLSLLGEGRRVPSGQTWLGSPARAVDQKPTVTEEQARAARSSTLRRAAFAALHAVGVFVLPVVYLAAILPGVVLINYWSRVYGGAWFLLGSPAVAICFIVLMALEIAAVKWLLLGRVKPGRHRVESFFYLRKWFFDQLMDLSLDLLGPLYATIYLAPWYRMVGAKIGRKAEISTACATCPDLLTIDDESFIADGVTLGAAVVERGWETLLPTRVGKRSFVGNSAAVPAGTTIGDNTLIGCLSAPPLSHPGAAQNDTSWLGSPAIFLPQRQVAAGFSAESTFKPTRRLWAMRALIEFFRVTLPTTVFVALTSMLISAVPIVEHSLSLLTMVLIFPLLYGSCGILAALVVVATKWILMGRYRSTEKPLWSTFVWRTELLTAMHENLADPFLVHVLTGTPFVCWFFRLLGSKIGRRVYMETTQLTEFDLITIGDDVTLNCECTVQTHLFEDRVMKMSTIEIADGCSVGCGAIVLYDSKMERRSTLGDQSLLMKGESLPAGTRWEGTPARRLVAAQADSAGAVPTGAPAIMPADAPASPAPRREPAPALAPAPTAQVVFMRRLEDYDPGAPGPHVWVLDLDAPESPALAMDAPAGKDEPAGLGRHCAVAGEARQDAVGRLVRRILARQLGLEAAQVVFDIDPHGRPALATDKMPHCERAATLDFNIAHSQNVLLAGFASTGRVGVDVEVIDPALQVGDLARTHFSPRELASLQALGDDQRRAAFYRSWTAKEAYIKGVGNGLTMSLDQIETAALPDGSTQVVGVNGSDQLCRGWRIAHQEFVIAGRSVIGAVAFCT